MENTSANNLIHDFVEMGVLKDGGGKYGQVYMCGKYLEIFG